MGEALATGTSGCCALQEAAFVKPGIGKAACVAQRDTTEPASTSKAGKATGVMENALEKMPQEPAGTLQQEHAFLHVRLFIALY